MIYRNILQKDKKAIMDLVDALNSTDQLDFSITSEWFEHIVNEANKNIFVAIDTSNNIEQVVGLATCMIDTMNNEIAQISIFVHPAYRNRGIGSFLYLKILSHAKKNKILLLETIVKKRLLYSIQFIEKRDFIPCNYIWKLELCLEDTNEIFDYSELESKYKIRRADLTDATYYKEILASCFQHEVSEEYFHLLLKDPSVEMYLLESIKNTDEIIGIICTQNRNVIGAAYIFDIAIKEKYRGKGLGSYLIMNVLSILKKKNISKAILTVDGENKDALSLYKKLGFIEVDEDILFSKRLR